MADPKPPDKPDSHQAKDALGSGAESPTTARPLDFDDEPLTPAVPLSGSSLHPAGEEALPAKPPRPLSPQQQAEATLREAFPTIDTAVVKAVLVASGGRVEPAFNALLSMSDPDSQIEPTPPPKPPRPTPSAVGPGISTTTPRNQLEADEMYARQLAEHYEGTGPNRGPRRTRTDAPLPRQKKETGLKPNELYDDREHSFLDDDLPVIKENIRKGFLETQSKVNQWVTQLKKKIDGEDDEPVQYGEQSGTGNYGYGPGAQQRQYGGRRSGDSGRRSTDRDRERYDADPRVLSDDFTGLDLRQDEAPRRSTRPLANPDLFKPTPHPPRSSSNNARKVSFQDDPSSDSLYRQPSPVPGVNTATAKQSKWEPLSTLDPSPVADDPFSLGDSDEERESKAKDIKSDDTERLKKAAAEAMAEDIGSGSGRKLEPHATTGPAGTRDKDAEDKLTGK